MNKKIINEIKRYEKIIIHRHVNPDGDALGSQYGLYEFIKLNFKDKIIFLVEGESEKRDFLSDVFPKKIKEPTKKDYEEALVFVLDTANSERIAGKNWENANFIIKIDHHPLSETYADIEFINPVASSTCEIIANSIIKNSEFKLNKKTANYLFIGMVTDTGRFLHDSVTPNTLSVASTLLSKNLDTSEIYKKLYNKPLNTIKFHAYVTSKIKVKKGVAYVMLPKNAHKKFNVSYEIASSSVFLLTHPIETVYALYSTWDEKKELWRTSLRSKDKPINDIAKKYGGGGHAKASGTKIVNKREFRKVLKDLKKLNVES